MCRRSSSTYLWPTRRANREITDVFRLKCLLRLYICWKENIFTVAALVASLRKWSFTHSLLLPLCHPLMSWPSSPDKVDFFPGRKNSIIISSQSIGTFYPQNQAWRVLSAQILHRKARVQRMKTYMLTIGWCVKSKVKGSFIMMEGKAEDGGCVSCWFVLPKKWVASVLTENEFWHNKWRVCLLFYEG